jgi:Bacterial Ig domain
MEVVTPVRVRRTAAVAAISAALLVATTASAASRPSKLRAWTVRPSSDQTVSGKISWEVGASGASVSRVGFFVDGQERSTEYLTPYVFDGDGNFLDTSQLADGRHTLSATVYAGPRQATTSVRVTVRAGKRAAAPASERAAAAPTSPSTLYSSTSVWNAPIPSSPAIAPNSAAMVETVLRAAQAQGFVVAAKHWSVPVYYADASTPRVDFSLTASWAPARRMTPVPVPQNAAPDPSSDGHMMIVDRSTGCEYDFWKAAKKAGGGWSAAWGNALLVNGTGVYPKGLSARGSGFGLGAGLIRPDELAAGEIDHALVFSFPTTKAGGPVAPATESDGQSTAAGAIPEGAQLQLDPELNLDSLRLTPWQRTIARALQRYGMILGDTGGGVSLYAQNPQSTSTPYAWGDTTYPSLPTQLVSHLRVLATGPQRKVATDLAATPCTTMR